MLPLILITSLIPSSLAAGFADTEDGDAEVYVYFYDANNRVLDKIRLADDVAPNTDKSHDYDFSMLVGDLLIIFKRG